MPELSSYTGALTQFSLKRRIAVFSLLLFILVIGTVASLGLPQELIPDGYSGNYIRVNVRWMDAPAREVLEKITIPLEEQLSTVKGLDRIYSNTRTGGAYVSIKFKTSADKDVAYREVRDRVERAKMVLPEDIRRPMIYKHDPSGMSIYELGLAIDPLLTDYYDLIQQGIIRPLERIDGVASVETRGLAEKEIIVEVNRAAIEAAGINMVKLGRLLSQDNFTMASGHTTEAGKVYFIRSIASYTSLEELENRLVTPNIYLKDIATIKYEELERRYHVRVNSKPALRVQIKKEGGANTVEVANAVAKLVDKMRSDPKLHYIRIEKLFSQGEMITDLIRNLALNGLYGALLAMLVLFFFLRRFRLTLIIALSIPLSLLITMTVMYFVGETLNILTLLALVISIGLLVDNSVVVAENILRLYHDQNYTKREACVRGAGEIALAIVTATLTTVVVFLPVSLVKGEMQFFLLRLSLPITIAVVASLLIALVFVPLSVYLSFHEKENIAGRPLWYRKSDHILTQVYERVFVSLRQSYQSCLVFFLTRRVDLVLSLILLLVATGYLSSRYLDVVPANNEDTKRFSIQLRTGYSKNYDEIRAYFQDVEKVLASRKEEFQLKDYLLFSNRNGGTIRGWVRDDVDSDYDIKMLAKRVAEALPEKPGYKLFYGQENTDDEKQTKNKYIVMLHGENPDLLEQTALELQPKILAIDGVIGMQAKEESAPTQLALVVDRERIAAADVSSDSVAKVVGGALRGKTLTEFNRGGHLIPMRMRYREVDRERLSDLASFYVPTEDGGVVSVAALTQSRMLNSEQGISRRNKKMSYRMTFDLDEENYKETRTKINILQANYDLPEGVSFSFQLVRDQEEIKNRLMAVFLSLVFMYLLMGFLFESFILPLSILITVPLASIGVVLAHLIVGRDMDSLGVVGVVLLSGVVVNNGIVLIDYVRRLREQGVSRLESLATAAQHRFRPIVMTALTTIVGMIPLTLSATSSMGISYKSFGLTLIGGMTTATLLTLLVVPVFYSLFDDLRDGAARLAKQLAGVAVKNAAAK